MAACFRRCYGETYPNDDFYDVARLTERIDAGSLRSVVAIADDGSLVGHTGLTVRHVGANAIEAGNTVVDPACRGQGLLARLAAALNELCRDAGYLAYLHYPTTAHEIMQKASVRGGFETGLMLDYIPAETDYRDIDQGDGRIAATVVYQPFAPAPPRTLWMAAQYVEIAKDLYDAAKLDRTLRLANGPATARVTSSAPSFSKRRGLRHAHVTTVGTDFASVAAATVSGDAAVVHVDLCLDDPGVGPAVETLRDLGFFFCALLPEFAHTDVLRMQHLTSPAATSFAPKLSNAGAARLLELMRREHQVPGTGF